MATGLSSMKAPSIALLRTFLRPTTHISCQTRATSNWVPRHKYAKINSLDKLHRKQKKDLRQEKMNSHIRATSMQPPSYAPQPSLSSATPTPSAPEPSSPTPKTTQTTIPYFTGPPSKSLDPPPSSSTQSMQLPYLIARTTSHQLPVYEKAKAGGTKHVTQLRKLSGDLNTLQTHLRDALAIEQYFIDRQGRKKENVSINWRTRQISVRGWRGPEVKKWAQMSGF